MTNKYMIISLFLIVCLGIRFYLTLRVKNHDRVNKNYYSLLLLFISLCFIMQYTLRIREKGLVGNYIWWDDYRPIHGILYLLGAIMVYNENKNAYKPILLDTILGLVFFINKYK